MKRTISLFLMTAMLFVMLAGCSGAQIPDEPPGILEPSAQLLQQISKDNAPAAGASATDASDIEYHIVFDNGCSMKGFISPHCYSYSVMLSSIMEAAFNGARSFYTASDVASGRLSASTMDSFLQKTNSASFYLKDTNNSIAQTIDGIAQMASANDNPNSVYVLVSDLMIPSEDECLATVETIKHTFLSAKDSSAGVMGIMSDFSGRILNLPVDTKSGKPREIPLYAVIDKDVNEVFRHPLYALFMGNDQLVYQAMEQAVGVCNDSAILDESNPVHSLYYFGYNARGTGEGATAISFDTGISAYDKADYNMRYVLRGLPDEYGSIEYPSEKPLLDQEIELFKKIPCLKLYKNVLPESKPNVRISCSLPYSVRVVPEVEGVVRRDRFNLMSGEQELELDKNDYGVEVSIAVLEGDGANAKWTDVDSTVLSVAREAFDFPKKVAQIELQLDPQKLDEDTPQIFAVTTSIVLDPQWGEIGQNYAFDWLKGWTLNLKKFSEEHASFSAAQKKTSAVYTSASTSATPYLYSLLGSGLGDGCIEQSCNDIADSSRGFAQTAVFGVVVRDTPEGYVPHKWSEEEDFGWAFSRNDATELLSIVASEY